MSKAEDSVITHHSEMELIILNKFRHRIEKQHILNTFSSRHYGKLNNYLIIPTIAITSISSVASFLTTSTVIPDGSKQYLALCIGILTAIASIFQTLDSSLGYSVKKKSFSNAAIKYNDLITKIEFEICNPNEKFTEFCDYIEESILQIKNDCKYTPPTVAFDYYNKNKKKIIKDNDSLDSLVYSNQQYSQTNITKMAKELRRASDFKLNKNKNYNTFDNSSSTINDYNKKTNNNIKNNFVGSSSESSNSDTSLNNSFNSRKPQKTIRQKRSNNLNIQNQQQNQQQNNNSNNNSNSNNNISINIEDDDFKRNRIIDDDSDNLEYDDEFNTINNNKKNNIDSLNSLLTNNQQQNEIKQNNNLSPITSEHHVINFETSDVSDI